MTEYQSCHLTAVKVDHLWSSWINWLAFSSLPRATFRTWATAFGFADDKKRNNDDENDPRVKKHHPSIRIPRMIIHLVFVPAVLFSKSSSWLRWIPSSDIEPSRWCAWACPFTRQVYSGMRRLQVVKSWKYVPLQVRLVWAWVFSYQRFSCWVWELWARSFFLLRKNGSFRIFVRSTGGSCSVCFFCSPCMKPPSLIIFII